jgi:hypothetical protein
MNGTLGPYARALLCAVALHGRAGYLLGEVPVADVCAGTRLGTVRLLGSGTR